MSLTCHFFFPWLQVKESPSGLGQTINYKKSSPGFHFKPKLKDQGDKIIPQVKHFNTNEKQCILLLKYLMTVTSVPCWILAVGWVAQFIIAQPAGWLCYGRACGTASSNKDRYQTKLGTEEAGLERVYDLLDYRQTMHQTGIGVICAVGYLDFDSAHITASWISCGFLPWCTGKMKLFLLDKKERYFYCHIKIVEMYETLHLKWSGFQTKHVIQYSCIGATSWISSFKSSFWRYLLVLCFFEWNMLLDAI